MAAGVTPVQMEGSTLVPLVQMLIERGVAATEIPGGERKREVSEGLDSPSVEGIWFAIGHC